MIEFTCQFYFLPFFRKNSKIKLSCKESVIPKGISISNKIKFLLEREYPECKCEIITRSLREYPSNDLFIVIIPNWRKDGSRKVNSINFCLVTALDEEEAYAAAALVLGKYITKKRKVSVSKIAVVTEEVTLKKKIQMQLNFAGN